MGTASAHVYVQPSSAVPGAPTDLVFAVPHGCDGSPTTSVRISITETVTKIAPTVNPNWTIAKEMNGDKVFAITYTAKEPLPDDLRDTFTLTSLLAKDLKENDVVRFPTLQTCEQGSVNWESADESAKEPAPAVTVSAPAQSNGHSHDHSATAETSDNQAEQKHTVDTTATSSNSTTWAIGISVLSLVVAIGAIILAIRGRSGR